MTGKEILDKLNRGEYYPQKEEERGVLLGETVNMICLIVIVLSLLSIAGHVSELFQNLK